MQKQKCGDRIGDRIGDRSGDRIDFSLKNRQGRLSVRTLKSVPQFGPSIRSLNSVPQFGPLFRPQFRGRNDGTIRSLFGPRFGPFRNSGGAPKLPTGEVPCYIWRCPSCGLLVFFGEFLVRSYPTQYRSSVPSQLHLQFLLHRSCAYNDCPGIVGCADNFKIKTHNFGHQFGPGVRPGPARS